MVGRLSSRGDWGIVQRHDLPPLQRKAGIGLTFVVSEFDFVSPIGKDLNNGPRLSRQKPPWAVATGSALVSFQKRTARYLNGIFCWVPRIRELVAFSPVGHAKPQTLLFRLALEAFDIFYIEHDLHAGLAETMTFGGLVEE